MQVAPPAEIYEQPNSRWIADFIGSVNLFEGRVGDDGASVEGTVLGRLRVAAKIAAEPGATVWVAVRPETVADDAEPARAGPPSGRWKPALPRRSRCRLSGRPVDLSAAHRRRRAAASEPIANIGPSAQRTIAANDKVWLNFPRAAAIVLTR